MNNEDTWRMIGGYFSPDEFQHPEKIDSETLLVLYEMRKEEGDRNNIIITINEDYAETGHSSKSFHSKDGICRALDIVIRDSITGKPLPILDQLFIALRYNWNAVGFYPYWYSPGLHVDTGYRGYYRKAIWFRDEKGKYVYDPFKYIKEV